MGLATSMESGRGADDGSDDCGTPLVGARELDAVGSGSAEGGSASSRSPFFPQSPSARRSIEGSPIRSMEARFDSSVDGSPGMVRELRASSMESLELSSYSPVRRTVSRRLSDADYESPTSTMLQILFPYLLAGAGMVTAGLVLDAVKGMDVYVNVPEIFILVPALLGLKGNLEMTLASRLTTHAGLGNLDTHQTAVPIIAGNLVLIQCQAIVVGFLAAAVATFMSFSTGLSISVEHVLLMCSSAIVTASLASFFLALIMVSVVLLCLHFDCNPDNVAAPIAASLGDLTTLSLLSYIAEWLFQADNWASEASIIAFYVLLLAPVCAYMASREPNAARVLRHGWTPVLASMVISSSGGVIMAQFEGRFPKMAAFQPVMNGAGGNLVAVQASRIGTHLHKQSEIGHLVHDRDSLRSWNPCFIFCGRSVHARTSRILMFLVVPGHLIFFAMIRISAADEGAAGPGFFGFYVLAALAQEWLLLYVCLHLVHFQWSVGIDPDSAAVPYLTALGDLCGTALLTLVFEVMGRLGFAEALANG